MDTPIGIRVGKLKSTLITTPEHIQAMFKNSRLLSNKPVTIHVLDHILGASKKLMIQTTQAWSRKFVWEARENRKIAFITFRFALLTSISLAKISILLMNDSWLLLIVISKL